MRGGGGWHNGAMSSDLQRHDSLHLPGTSSVGVLVLHEQLTPTAVTGIAVIVVGLVLLTRPARTTATVPAAS